MFLYFDETSTIRGHPLRIHITTFEGAMNLGWCSKVKAPTRLLLNWVYCHVCVPPWKNQAPFCYKQAKSAAVLCSACCPQPTSTNRILWDRLCVLNHYPVCIAKINWSCEPKPRDLTNDSKSKESKAPVSWKEKKHKEDKEGNWFVLFLFKT